MSDLSPAGLSDEETIEAFDELQHALIERWLRIRDIDSGPRDIVVVPSLSLEGLPMSTIPGITHYEERMLFTLMLLRHPRARLVYITSQPLHPATVDYLIALVCGIPAAHVRQRLTLLSTYDSSPRTLTEKILERPRLVERIRRAIRPEQAHMTCFTVSSLERRLAVALSIPLYGVNPKLLHFGSKSGSRQLFREAGVRMPEGVEGVHTEREVAEAISDVWELRPDLSRMVVKHDHGFSGEGNAVMRLDALAEVKPGAADRQNRVARIEESLPGMRLASKTVDYDGFKTVMADMGGIVEAFVDGKSKRSPSGQLRINPRAELECVSTHDQLLSGPDGQTYDGCRFPAEEAYRHEIQRESLRVGEILVKRGVVGRVAVDFIAVEDEEAPGRWDLFAIEINLRMSGTTHPMMLMRMLNGGGYDQETGLYHTGRGEPRYYVATDTLMSPSYRGLMVDDLLDIGAIHGLHHKPFTDSGVIFHLTGALSEFGKLGITCVGATVEEADGWFERTVAVLDRETKLGSR